MPTIGFDQLMPAIIVPAMLLASWNDYRRHRIPNWLNGAVLFGGFLTQWAYGGMAGLTLAAQGMGVGLALLGVLWLLGCMGAGDVKFMAALGAWLGPTTTFHALVAGILLGGVLGAVLLVRRADWRNVRAGLCGFLTRLSVRSASGRLALNGMDESGAVLPYAVPLTCGTLIVLVLNQSGWWEVL